jgi:hypothetical protein
MSAQVPLGAGYFLTSELESGAAAELEKLFYFNPNQWKIRPSLEVAIQKYGTPQIAVSHGAIQMLLEKIQGHQTLFLRCHARGDQLAGAIVYVREREALRVLFFALKPEHTMKTLNGVNPLAMMFEALQGIGRRIAGVNSIVCAVGRKEIRLPIPDRL